MKRTGVTSMGATAKTFLTRIVETKLPSVRQKPV